jgi:hypothetical protein
LTEQQQGPVAVREHAAVHEQVVAGVGDRPAGRQRAQLAELPEATAARTSTDTGDFFCQRRPLPYAP